LLGRALQEAQRITRENHESLTELLIIAPMGLDVATAKASLEAGFHVAKAITRDDGTQSDKQAVMHRTHAQATTFLKPLAAEGNKLGINTAALGAAYTDCTAGLTMRNKMADAGYDPDTFAQKVGSQPYSIRDSHPMEARSLHYSNPQQHMHVYGRCTTRLRPQLPASSSDGLPRACPQ
jgi:hypothetical protein